MAYPIGEANKGALRLDFDRRLMLRFPSIRRDGRSGGLRPCCGCERALALPARGRGTNRTGCCRSASDFRRPTKRKTGGRRSPSCGLRQSLRQARFEAILWLRKGFGFAGAWTGCEQNRMLSICFGLPASNKA